ncbi:RagB/SusD family nutrient uptake outer membrane protein [Mucilaginibacter sp. HMF5004]|uniref:RagB/SusD family nutrient uptake outer membrane protein n=1 Tax=Mucilaginibacter rivuli TaxID=2857527 RepID=UPI001C5ED7DC|nr:RagB/SusD family nutrient uptake outer membrane protein [Mucilaginibacter rivuli]MBW4889144.1 RagB/SusD family nutrient uptake outer membrane protein [Mucilaginibacter rivuli]
MYKGIIYRSVLIITLVFSSSCGKYLTLYPQNGTIRQEFWQNKEQLQSAIIGVYSSLIQGTPGKSGDRQMADWMFRWGELRADNITTSLASPNADDVFMINGNVLATNSGVQWYSFYRTINLCNTVLKYAPDVISSDPTLTQAQLNSYLAEALTIRAMMYFYLVKTFGDVPLKLKPTSTDADLEQLAKTPQATILTQILTDLNTAEQSAVFTYGNTASNKGRITKYAVNALQAEVYLYKYDYANCIIACEKIRNSGQFGLVKGDGNFFNAVYSNGNSSESIFEFQYDGSTTQVNPFYPMFNLSTGGSFAAQINVRGTLFPVDVNDDSNVDVRAAIAANGGSGAIAKWIGTPNSNAILSATTTFRHWIIYRYAEILLFEAEAYAYTPGKGQAALDLVKLIQNRANNIYDPLLSMPVPDPNDANAVGLYVLDERNREFIYEGKRWYDLVRYAKRDFPNTSNILTDALAINASAALQQILISKYKDPNAYYLPIYYNEIVLDPNLVQNPYYK